MKATKLSTFLFLLILSATSNLLAQNTFPASGNVGIGTVSPGTTLDVIQGGVSSMRVKSVENTSVLILSRGAASSSYSSQVTFASGATSEWGLGTSQGSAPASDWSVFNYNTYTNGMTISASNNYVGIGTTSPGQKLDVLGWMRVQGNGGGNRDNSGGIEFYNFSDPSNNVQAQIKGLRGLNDWKAGQLGFYTAAAGGTLSERMTITETGSIGIGITSPTEKLSVNGNILARKIIITKLGWSDYVFNDDYKLRPLLDVAQFIKQNKHLPDVPSAKEVEDKGIDLGDNQALLLKKIEELTLYVIELKEENKRQDKKISQIVTENQKLKQIIKEKK